jgi:hypothetical protein
VQVAFLICSAVDGSEVEDLFIIEGESCLEGVNRQVETFSTKTRNELGKTSSTGVKTGSTGLHELN